MGRFGNQVDQLLGVLAFARSLDRTLVLPNFIEYNHPKTDFIPFETVFQLNSVKKYTKVITTSAFTRTVAPQIWPEEKRKAFCWSKRESIFDTKQPAGCHAKEGNPFGPYWDNIGVNFKGDEFFGTIPGGYEISMPGNRRDWEEKFPVADYPVLAFTSAPAGFPSQSKYWDLQKYLKWNSRIVQDAKKFINQTLTKPFVGIHLRNNLDWDRACEHVDPEKNRVLFASAQCLGDGHHLGRITKTMCSPTKKVILEQVVDAVGSIGAKSVFVSSDHNSMIDELNEALNAYDVKAYKLESDNLYESLAILARSDLFVGNCVSTFSHIVKRERDHGFASVLPTVYFGLASQKRRIEL